MVILVDTSVWVDHFRNSNRTLIQLLHCDLVLMHPMVLAEIACGTPPAPRQQTLKDLGLLPQSHQASMTEVLAFLENERLYGLGCGLVDITLLASTLITPSAKIWTLDKRLAYMAQRLGVDYRPIH